MKYLKGLLSLLLTIFTIDIIFFPAVVFIHEETHYIMYTLEGIEITSFHVLDLESLETGRAGYITTEKESKYGALFQEVVANCVTFLFLASILFFSLVKPLKNFTIRQFYLMGVKKNYNHTVTA